MNTQQEVSFQKQGSSARCYVTVLDILCDITFCCMLSVRPVMSRQLGTGLAPILVLV